MLNIKKLIALVLSVSLLLGIVASSASADELATDSISYSEGVSVEYSTTIAEETTTLSTDTILDTIIDSSNGSEEVKAAADNITYLIENDATKAEVCQAVAELEAILADSDFEGKDELFSDLKENIKAMYGGETTTAPATESTTVAEETTTEAPATETTTESTTVPETSEETTDAPAVTPSDVTPRRISVVVNGDTKSAKGITWYTTANTSSVVEITTVDGAKVSANIAYTDVMEWEGNFVHKATVTGLAAGTTYKYRVGNGVLFSNWGTFVTDNGDDKVNFVAIADIQAGNLENFIKGAETAAAAYKVMPDAEFMINLGDFTDDSTNEEWDYYDTAMADVNLNSTLVPIAGNHDGLGVWNWFNNMFNLDTSESVQVLNGVNYSFDYGNAHFAVLNTNDLLSISIAQLTWLRNDMNSTDKDWKIVLMHKSPYSLGKDAKWPDALYLQRSLTSVLDSCGVDLVMSGHDHQYLRTKAIKNGKANEDGTVYVLAGTAGAKRYEVRSFLANHFLDTDIIDALVIHKNGYGNYWDGQDWDQTNEDYWGGCFNTISIDGGKLTFDSYILKDRPDEAPMDTPRETITKSDSFTLEKAVGQNKITFTGDNTTSEIEYYLGVVPSFFGLATYAIGEWLPKFLVMVPALLDSVINEDVF